MPRWLSFALPYVLVVVTAGGVGLYAWWPEALAAGRETYWHRRDLSGPAERLPPNPRRVAWLGDSHIMDAKAYPWIVGRQLDGIDTVVRAIPGLDAFGYYVAIDRELDHRRPAVLGLVAQLNTLQPGYGRPVPDLVSELPAGELPHAMSLPLHEMGLTIPKVLLFRALRWPWVENVFLALDGIRRLARDALFGGWLGPLQLPSLVDFSEALEVVNAPPAMPFSARTAKVRFLTETVRMASERGVRVLVVLEPLPIDQLRKTGHYDPARLAPRIAVLRAEIERAGGTLVDLHDVIDADGFLDFAGHLNDAGHAEVADRLREPLAQLMADPPRAVR